MTVTNRFAITLAYASFAALSLGCSAQDPGTGSLPGGEVPTRPAPPGTATPETPCDPSDPACVTCKDIREGCLCEPSGAQIDCGKVLRVSGDYVSCSIGKRSCLGSGRWGACVGDRVADAPTGASKGTSSKDLSTGSTDCKDNPCDPYCKRYPDDSTGLVVKRPLLVDEGLTIAPEPPPKLEAIKELIVLPNPGKITVRAIPRAAAPITDPFRLRMRAELVPVTGANIPVDAALWSLDSYDSTLIDEDGDLNVISAIARTVKVSARVGTLTGSALVQVVVDANEVDPLVPAKVATLFAPSSDPDTATFLYPYSGTKFPRGITPPVAQWDNGGVAADAVKISLRYKSAAGDSDFFWSRIVLETAVPRYDIPRSVWWALDQTASGQTAELAIQRVVGGSPKAELVHKISFSTEPLRGSIYYWEINRGSVARLDAETGIRTSQYLTPTAGKGRCVACHSVSADGTTIVVQHDGGNAGGGLYDALTGKQIYDRGGVAAQWQALSPTGKWTIWGDAGNLSLSNDPTVVASLQRLQDKLLGVNNNDGVLTPAFAPNGRSVAYTSRSGGFGRWGGNWYYGLWDKNQWIWNGGWKNLPVASYGWQNAGATGLALQGNNGWYVDFYAPAIWVADFAETAPYFSNLRQIVAETDPTWRTAATPSYNSASTWLAYQRADRLRTRDNKGQLRMVSASGADHVSLDNANGKVIPGHLTNVGDLDVSYEPTFSPEASGGSDWMVFISNRSYGNVIPSCGSQPNCGRKQMWVSAVSRLPTDGVDASLPAFWLPGQEINNQNMRGFWAKSPCKPPQVGAGTGAVLPLWRSIDIGDVGVAGSSTASGTNATVKGSGWDIWDNSDGFHFRYQQLIGDGSITAKVTAVGATDAWAKAGVMMRATLDTSSEHAMVVGTSANGTSFQRRVDAGGPSLHDTNSTAAVPQWVRLVRTGNRFDAYRSLNGTTWLAMGSEMIVMPTAIYMGLAVSAHNNTSLNTSTFTNLLTINGTAPPAPSTGPSSCSAPEDCCGWDPDPAKSLAACRIDTPLTYPISRTCRKITPGVCSDTGGSCSVDADCCNFTSTTDPERCAAGECRKVSKKKYKPASFSRDYEGTCGTDAGAIWRFFDWKTKTPSDSSILISVQTAGDQAGLDAATIVDLAVVKGLDITTWTGADVEAALRAKGFKSLRWLRVNITLLPSTDTFSAPTLVEWRANYSCQPNE